MSKPNKLQEKGSVMADSEVLLLQHQFPVEKSNTTLESFFLLCSICQTVWLAKEKLNIYVADGSDVCTVTHSSVQTLNEDRLHIAATPEALYEQVMELWGVQEFSTHTGQPFPKP